MTNNTAQSATSIAQAAAQAGPVSRRQLFKIGLGLAGATLAARTIGAQPTPPTTCKETPAQPEGPFYPVRERRDQDNDLTQVAGRSGTAAGEVILVRGIVSDATTCQPISGALVEIWQANAHGRYDHPGDDTSTRPRDPNFQHWGRAITNANGRYQFKTVIPGWYAAGRGWVRPPHIHYKVHRRGYHELTTQMYFAGNRFNAEDLLLQSLPATEQADLLVAFARENDGNGNSSGGSNEPPVGVFNLQLRPVGGARPS